MKKMYNNKDPSTNVITEIMFLLLSMCDVCVSRCLLCDSETICVVHNQQKIY